MILGAGLEKNGKPSDILMDRIQTGVSLYQKGKVEYLIMSGSCRKNYDEPEAMRTAAINLGIPAQAILLDQKGVSTLDSCITIKEKIAPEQILVVSQFFHLPRAIMLQTLLGIKTIGIQANIYHFSRYKKVYWYFRELLSIPYNLFKYLLYRIR
jgi:vancomycin permeability regulator SanA